MSYLDAVGYVEPGWKPLVWLSEAKAELENVKREGTTLDADITSFKSTDPKLPAFKSAWTALWQEFNAFYAASSKTVFFGAAEIYERSVAYGKKLNDYRVQFLRFPGASSTEPDHVPPPDDPHAVPWRTVTIGAVVVAGLFGGGYALSKVVSAGSLFKKTA